MVLPRICRGSPTCRVSHLHMMSVCVSMNQTILFRNWKFSPRWVHIVVFFNYLFISRAPMTCVLLSLTHCASCCCPNAPDPRPRFLYPLVTRASILLGRPVAHSHIISPQIKSPRTRVTAKMRGKITISSKSSNRA